MTKSTSHRRAQGAAAGKSGKTEVPVGRGRRLDARTKSTATEVERSGDSARLRLAARRLKQSHAPRKVLQVPQKDMPKAAEAMKTEGAHGSVKNMTGTKRRSV